MTTQDAINTRAENAFGSLTRYSLAIAELQLKVEKLEQSKDAGVGEEDEQAFEKWHIINQYLLFDHKLSYREIWLAGRKSKG